MLLTLWIQIYFIHRTKEKFLRIGNIEQAMFNRTVSIEKAPDKATGSVIGFFEGDPVFE